MKRARMTANKKAAERKIPESDPCVNISRLVRSLLLPTEHQGWTFEEVLAEVNRRHAGEYVMGKRESDNAHDRAVRVLLAQYMVSGFAAALASTLNLSEIELKHVFGSYEGLNSVDVVKNPYPKRKGAKDQSLHANDIVSEIYPGDIYKQQNR